MNGLCVILLSGGMDSCVTAAVAAQRNDLALLHLDYGQRTRLRERRAFDRIGDHYAVPQERRLVVESGFLSQIGGSALTDPSIAVPESGSPAGVIPVTYVPFRNAHLLSLGVSWAETLGASAIFIGVVEEDSSGYPDCTEAFCRAFASAANLGTRPGVELRIETPLIHLSKADIVRRGADLGAPLQLTWSCYVQDEVACGRCDSCRLRLDAFQAAGVQDPLPYE
jgi:7-cyano-7-deazaguanine synthase